MHNDEDSPIAHSMESFEIGQDELDKAMRLTLARFGDETIDRVSLEDSNQLLTNLHAQLSTESFEKFKTAMSAVSQGAKVSILGTKKVLESLRVAFDSTNQRGLERARRLLEANSGDLVGNAVVNKRGLAKRIHVDGDVTTDMARPTARLLTDAKFYRTTVVPSISRDVTQAINLIYTSNIRSGEQFHQVIVKLMGITETAKSLTDFYSDADLDRRYPGGLSVPLQNARPVLISENRKVTDKSSVAVLQKLEKTVARKWTIAKNPLRYRKEPRTNVVRLLDRTEAEQVLNYAQDLIKEGIAVTEVSRVFKDYPAASVGSALRAMLSSFEGTLVKDPSGQVEQVDHIAIDSDDRSRANWAATFYSLGVMQYHLMLPAMASILFEVANGYIKWVEESIRHYK